MLLQWRERTPHQQQRRQLRTALREAHLVDVAEKYVPESKQKCIHVKPNAELTWFNLLSC